MTISLAAAVFAVCGVCAAQDPSIDLPHERVAIMPEHAMTSLTVQSVVPGVSSYVAQGLAQLANGDTWKAAGSFREVMHRDESAAIGYLGMALAASAYPRTAATYAWKAYDRRESASPVVRKIVEAYAHCYDADGRPMASEPAYDTAPAGARLAVLGTALTKIAADHPGSQVASSLRDLQREASRASPSAAASSSRDARMPRNPRFDFGDGPWQPMNAPGFDLVRGLGGRRQFEFYKGKPIMVVFFLGFG